MSGVGHSPVVSSGSSHNVLSTIGGAGHRPDHQEYYHSLKTEKSNATHIYQGFCDRNTKLKNREDELLKVISKLEAKKAELQKSLSQPEFHGNDTDNTNAILKARLEEIISTSGVFIQRSNVHNDNNEMPHSSHIVEPSSRNLIFETRDLFR